MIEFKEFQKISRLNREIIVTEKIDGTNGQVHIRPASGDIEHGYDCQIDIGGVAHYIRAGSRNRWVPHVGGDDNNGFGRWDLPVYFQFSSTACRRVKVGTQTVEQDVYETVCDELMPYEQATQAKPVEQPADNIPV